MGTIQVCSVFSKKKTPILCFIIYEGGGELGHGEIDTCPKTIKTFTNKIKERSMYFNL